MYYLIEEIGAGCQILWFLIFEETVFAVSLSIISSYILPINLRPFGFSEKKKGLPE